MTVTTGWGLALFFTIAFAFTWLFHLILIVRRIPFRSRTGQALYHVGLLGPLLSALLVSVWVGGGAGLAQLWQSVIHWRFELVWYGVALFSTAALYGVGAWLYSVFGGRRPQVWFELPAQGWWLLLALLYVVLAQEVGWRGVALPGLQHQLGPLGASLVLGVVWACWSLPMFYVPGSNHDQNSMLAFVFFTTSWSLIMTLLFNVTAGSVLACLLFHGATNFWGITLKIPERAYVHVVVLLALMDVGLVVWFLLGSGAG